MALRDRFRDAPVYQGLASSLSEGPRTFDTKTWLAGSGQSRKMSDTDIYIANLPGQKNSFSNYEELQDYASMFGQAEKAEPEGPGAFKRTMQVLNTGASLGAGFLAGATDNRQGNTFSKMGDYWSEIDGYGALLKQWGLRENNWQTKFVRGVLGLAGDIFLDPTTYIPWVGWGLAANKILQRGGKLIKAEAPQRVFNTATREWITRSVEKTYGVVPEGVALLDKVRKGRVTSWTEQLLAENKQLGNKAFPEDVVRKQAAALAQKDVDRILYDSIVKTGKLDVTAFDDAFIRTAGRKNLEELQRLAPTMIDKGGLKLFGKNLLGSRVFADTEVGQAAQRIYETSGFGELVEAIKRPLGEMFVYAFRRNPTLMKLIERGDANTLMQLQKLFGEDWVKTLNSLSKDEQAEVVEKALVRKFEQLDKISAEEARILGEIETQGGELGKAMAGIVKNTKTGRGSAEALDTLGRAYERELKALQGRLTQIVRPLGAAQFRNLPVEEGQKMLMEKADELKALREELAASADSEIALALNIPKRNVTEAEKTIDEIIPEEVEASAVAKMAEVKKEIVAKQILGIEQKIRALIEAQQASRHGDIEDIIGILEKAGFDTSSIDNLVDEAAGAVEPRLASELDELDVSVEMSGKKVDGKQGVTVNSKLGSISGYYDSANKKLVINKFKLPDNAPVTEPINAAYHAGDLGVAADTTLGHMDYGRGTGHFGTGVYFVGRKNQVTYPGSTYGKRPLQTVTFDGLKMVRPTTDEAGYALHDAMKGINRASLTGKELSDFDLDMLTHRIYLETYSSGKTWEETRNTIKDAIAEVKNELSKAPQWESKGDTAATRVIKKLGFDGVDVRKLGGLDNTGFGSVVYYPEKLKKALPERMSPSIKNARNLSILLERLTKNAPVYQGAGKEISVSSKAAIELRTSNEATAAVLRELGLKESGGVIKKFTGTLEKFRSATAAARMSEQKFSAATLSAVAVQKEIRDLLLQAQGTYKKLLEHYNVSSNIKKQYAAADKLMFKNPNQQKLADMLWYGDNAIMKQVAKLAGVSEDQIFQEYVPTFFKDIATVNAFGRGRGSKLNKTIGEPAQHWNIDEIRDKIVRDPNELATKIARIAIVNKQKMDIVNKTIKQLGKPLDFFAKRDEAGKIIGYDYEAALKAGYKKFTVVDPVKKQTRAAAGFEEGEQYVKGMTEKELKEFGIEDINPKVVEGDVVIGGWVRQELYDELADIFKTHRSVKDIFEGITYFDYATRLFKGYMTSLFPAFQLQNIASNGIQAMLQGGYGMLDPNLMKMSWMMSRSAERGATKKIYGPVNAKKFLQNQTIVSRDGKVMNAYKFLKEVKRLSPMMFNTGQYSQAELAAEGLGKWTQGKWNPLNIDNAALRAGREAGATFENQAKLAIVMDTWQKGGTIEQGLEMAEEAIFNYSKLTFFEREVMRRLIPFYTFARKNAEYQMRKLLISPGYTAAQYKVFNNLDYSLSEGAGTDEDGLPFYLRSQLGFGVGKVGEGGKYYSSFGLPIEEFLGRLNSQDGIVSGVIRTTLASANPILKYPLELGFDKDIFRNRPITEISNPGYMIEMIGGMDNTIGKQFKQLLDFRTTRVPVYRDGKIVGYQEKAYANPYVLHFLRSMPFARFGSTVTSATDAARMSGDTGLSAEGIFNTITNVAGVNVIRPDEARQKFYDDLNKYKELGDWLQRAGYDVRKYETYYKYRTPVEKAIDKGIKE